MIMIDQKQAVEARRKREENRRGAVLLAIVAALIMTADSIVNWVVAVVS